MSIYDELRALIRRLQATGIDYALCGGLAMAAHGWPRSTMDIDLLIEERDLERVRAIARELGFTQEQGEMALAAGRVRLVRLVKLAGKEALPLDVLLVTPALRAAWEQRMIMETDGGPLWVVTAPCLAAMKRLRGSGQDLDDIRKLEEP